MRAGYLRLIGISSREMNQSKCAAGNPQKRKVSIPLLGPKIVLNMTLWFSILLRHHVGTSWRELNPYMYKLLAKFFSSDNVWRQISNVFLILPAHLLIWWQTLKPKVKGCRFFVCCCCCPPRNRPSTRCNDYQRCDDRFYFILFFRVRDDENEFVTIMVLCSRRFFITCHFSFCGLDRWHHRCLNLTPRCHRQPTSSVKRHSWQRHPNT